MAALVWAAATTSRSAIGRMIMIAQSSLIICGKVGALSPGKVTGQPYATTS